MKLCKFEAVIAVCLALAGRAAAASAWGVITSVDYPELATTAALLKELGYAGPLSGPFTGTLLLPNNDAWDGYIRATDYLPTLDASGGKAEAGFFAALMRYHTLLRAVANPYVGGTWSTKHMKEPGFIRHKISFENDSISAFAVDEQEGTANIANKRSQKVTGGGYIHVIDAVLEPDDLFKSLNVMMTSWADEDLDNFADLLQELGMQTMWSDKCKWISNAAFFAQGYENITQSPFHSCAPSTGQDCGPYVYDPVAAMSPGGLVAFKAIIMDDWDDRVTRATNAGTLALERFAGTFLLPNNMALPDITMRSAKEWIPALQFHFISAGSAPVAFTSNQLMRWTNGRFPAPNARVNLLGKMLQNPAYKTTFISLNGVSTGCSSPPCLSVQYPTKGRIDSARFLDKAVNLRAPNVLYHVIQKVMVPPCGTDDACYAAFRKP